MDSRLYSKNLNSSLVSSALICYRTVKQVTTQPPGSGCVTGTSPTAYVTQSGSALAHSQRQETHLSEPRRSFHITTQQRSTVLCTVGIIQFHSHPRKAGQFHFFSGNMAPSSFQLLISHHSLQNQLFPFNRPEGISKPAI